MDTAEDRIASAEALWRAHTQTGEPLSEEEIRIVVEAGLASDDEWEDRGGGLYWHAPTWPSEDE